MPARAVSLGTLWCRAGCSQTCPGRERCMRLLARIAVITAIKSNQAQAALWRRPHQIVALSVN